MHIISKFSSIISGGKDVLDTVLGPLEAAPPPKPKSTVPPPKLKLGSPVMVTKPKEEKTSEKPEAVQTKVIKISFP